MSALTLEQALVSIARLELQNLKLQQELLHTKLIAMDNTMQYISERAPMYEAQLKAITQQIQQRQPSVEPSK